MRKISLSQMDLVLISEAFHFSMDAHKDTCRKEGIPYITHPFRIAGAAIDLGMNTDSIIAALLHDVVEDTDIPLKAIESRFGSTVASIVDALSKPPSGTANRMLIYRKKLLDGPAEARMLKLLDIRDNLSDVDDFLPEEQAIAYRKKRLALAEELTKDLGDIGAYLYSLIDT